MQKLLWMAAIVACVALPLGAAEQVRPGRGGPDQGGRPDRRPGDREAGPEQPPGPPPDGGPGRGPGDRQGGPGQPPGGPGGGMFGGPARPEFFDAARKTVQLTDNAKSGVDLLEAQFGDDLQTAITQALRKLSRDYVAKILALLPDEEKPKYEAVAKALDERDEALAAAQKELKAALDKVKTTQGADKAPRDDRRRRGGPPGGSMDSKVDILRTHFVLNDQQQEMFEEIRRDDFDAMRQRMDNLFARLRNPGGPRNPDAFRQIGQAMRQIREKIDDETAALVAEVLTVEQKKDYAAACAAIDACRKKTKDAEEAGRKKIVEAVGDEKATALLGPPPGQVAQPKKPPTAF